MPNAPSKLRIMVPPSKTHGDTAADVYTFLFELQASGVCNMLMGAPERLIARRFHISEASAEAYVMNYIDNYEALKKELCIC